MMGDGGSRRHLLAKGLSRIVDVMKRRTMTCGLVLLFIISVFAGGCSKPGSRVELGGGPTGGTFQNFAVALAAIINREMPGVRVTAEHSGGSVDNLIQVERRKRDMGLAYAGDAYLASKGELRQGMPATEGVRALARLYGAAAQLVVPQASTVRTPRDLQKMRIAIGNPGSGSALAAQRYFRSLGIWEEVIPIYVGFDMGLEELRRENVNAVWLVVGFPNLSLRKFARDVPVRLLDLTEPTAASDFFTIYPYYSAVSIPAGTYPGQEHGVSTFQDATLLVAGTQVDEAFVYQALQLLFSEKGLQGMRAADPAAMDLAEKKGLAGVTIPLHPGAVRFWQEHGLLGH